VFAERYFTKDEFLQIEARYKSAIVSQDRKKLIEQLGMDIEKELILLGATAVEDAL